MSNNNMVLNKQMKEDLEKANAKITQLEKAIAMLCREYHISEEDAEKIVRQCA